MVTSGDYRWVFPTTYVHVKMLIDQARQTCRKLNKRIPEQALATFVRKFIPDPRTAYDQTPQSAYYENDLMAQIQLLTLEKLKDIVTEASKLPFHICEQLILLKPGARRDRVAIIFPTNYLISLMETHMPRSVGANKLRLWDLFLSNTQVPAKD